MGRAQRAPFFLMSVANSGPVWMPKTSSVLI
jgi:hypothetical protein